MGHQIGKSIGLLLLCLTTTSAASGARVVVENLYSDDSDNARQWRYYLGVDQPVDQPLASGTAGVRVGQWKLDDTVGTEHFTALNLRYDTGPSRRWRSRFDITQLSGDWSPTLGEANVSYKTSGPWYMEASAQRDIIDTVTAIRTRYSADTYSASADYALTPNLTLVGALYTQAISDGNNRVGKVARVIYSFSQIEGFNVQGRIKLVDSDFRGTGYFSPRELKEYMALTGYTRSIFGERWSVGAQAGIGVQSADDADSIDLFYGEVKIKGWFSDLIGLEAKANCSNTGGFSTGQSTTNYRYCLGSLSLISVW